MADLQGFKVDIFTGINDEIIAPTSSSGGNISHLYNRFNALIDTVQTELNYLKVEVAALSNNQSTPTLTGFSFTGVSVTANGGVVGTIPRTGKITKIIGHDNGAGEMGQYNTFFQITDPNNSSLNNVLTVEQWNTTPEGYFEWVFADDSSAEVVEGYILNVVLGGIELSGLEFEVFIYG